MAGASDGAGRSRDRVPPYDGQDGGRDGGSPQANPMTPSPSTSETCSHLSTGRLDARTSTAPPWRRRRSVVAVGASAGASVSPMIPRTRDVNFRRRARSIGPCPCPDRLWEWLFASWSFAAFGMWRVAGPLAARAVPPCGPSTVAGPHWAVPTQSVAELVAASLHDYKSLQVDNKHYALYY